MPEQIEQKKPQTEKPKPPTWVDYLSKVQQQTGLRDKIQPFEPGTRTLQGWGAEHEFMRWYLARLEMMAAQSAGGGLNYTPWQTRAFARTPTSDKSWMTSYGGSGYPAGHPYASGGTSAPTATAAPAAPASNTSWMSLFGGSGKT